MSEAREEVCLHYLGFGLCAKEFNASRSFCKTCDYYEPASCERLSHGKDKDKKRYAGRV